MNRARTFQVCDADTGRVVVERAREAGTLAQRLVGLLGKSEIGRDEALWLRANGVHTVGMRFAIDVVVLDSDGRVLRVARHISPNRFIWPVRGGRITLELAAGCADELGITAGVRLARAGDR